VKFDESKPKIFGLDSADLNKKVYVVEGPIDSLFLPNSIAFAGSSGDLDVLQLKDSVIILDNEPRKKETVQNYDRIIARGYNVFIWPEKYSDAKDINDLVEIYAINGQRLVDLIDSNVYSGLNAQIAIKQWKKV
jgi:hypothetical protein